MKQSLMKILFLTNLLIVALFLVTSCSQKDSGIHVSPEGADSNEGNIYYPVKTIQAAIDKAVPGQTIFIHEGTYREKVNIGKGKNGISLIAFVNEKPVLKGSDILKDWKKRDEYWFNRVEIKPQQVFVDGNNPLQQVGYPNDDFREVQKYPRYEYPVGKDLDNIAPGRFFWANDTVFIWLEDSSNPNSHQIEVSQRRYILNIDADSVLVRGLAFQHSNTNTFSEQGAAVSLGNYTTIEDCDVSWCDFGGIGMGYGSKAIRCNASYNGATGFNASNRAEDFLIMECKANYNNYRNFYAQWHAGGFKGASSAWGTIEDSEFAHNIGAGIWFDYCFERAKYRTNGPKPIKIRNNYIHDNSPKSNPNMNAALMLEVSEMADVVNNLIVNNGFRGIYISASWDINIINNTIVGTHGYCAVDVAGMPRGDKAHLTNIVIKNNIIYDNSSIYDIHLVKPNGIDIDEPVCDYNLIYRKNDTLNLWYSTDGRDGWQGETIHTLKDWAAVTPFDKHSISDNPGFIGNKFYLNDNSPAIDAGDGKANAIHEKDLAGNPRISGRSIDMGAFEYQNK